MNTETPDQIVEFEAATHQQLRTAAKGCGFDEMAAKWANFVYDEGKRATSAEVIKKFRSYGFKHIVIKNGRFLTVGR